MEQLIFQNATTYLPKCNVLCVFRNYKAISPRISMTSALFSTNSASALETKKSPHSKLLRVCSNRNVNLHFAAVEAEILQLNWDKAMKALVNDWVKGNKWSSFVELEENVRSYVNNNLPFLAPMWKTEKGGRVRINDGMQLADRVRMNYFPYEQIISAATKHAISGPIQIDTKHKLGKKVAEIKGRQIVLHHASKMLTSMMDFEMERQSNVTSDWTAHHESCSTCLRFIVSGSFLMWRRLQDVEQQLQMSEDGVLAEEEMHKYAMKWLSFCSNGQAVEDEDEVLQVGDGLIGGITQSDKSLLMGIAVGLSQSTNTDHKEKSTDLRKIVDEFF